MKLLPRDVAHIIFCFEERAGIQPCAVAYTEELREIAQYRPRIRSDSTSTVEGDSGQAKSLRGSGLGKPSHTSWYPPKSLGRNNRWEGGR